MSRMLRRLTVAGLLILLAAFFAFVGWNKAFAPLTELARHHAWTVLLPDWLGRLIGWSEMALVAGMLGAAALRHARLAGGSALVLVANQLAAAVVHLANGEAAALPQNALLIALLLIVVRLTGEAFGSREETA